MEKKKLICTRNNIKNPLSLFSNILRTDIHDFFTIIEGDEQVLDEVFLLKILMRQVIHVIDVLPFPVRVFHIARHAIVERNGR